MPIGGFNGLNRARPSRQFQQYVEDGDIHYFIAGGMGGGHGGGFGGPGEDGSHQQAPRSPAGWRRTSPRPRWTA